MKLQRKRNYKNKFNIKETKYKEDKELSKDRDL